MNNKTAIKILCVAAMIACGGANAQETNAGSAANSNAQTSASSISQSGGSAITSVGTSNNNTTAGNAFSATINVNQPAASGTDSATQTPKDAGALGSASNPVHSKSEIKTVGNPAAMSLAASFSQFNCANGASIGSGWLGGALSIGGPLESGPCNARANASALVILANALPNEDPMKRQLIDAAIRLIGESTSATAAALRASNVGFFTTVVAAHPPANPALIPPGYQLQVSPQVVQPGTYVGSDPIVINRLGISQAAPNPQQSQPAQTTPVASQNPPAQPIK